MLQKERPTALRKAGDRTPETGRRTAFSKTMSELGPFVGGRTRQFCEVVQHAFVAKLCIRYVVLSEPKCRYQAKRYPFFLLALLIHFSVSSFEIRPRQALVYHARAFSLSHTIVSHTIVVTTTHNGKQSRECRGQTPRPDKLLELSRLDDSLLHHVTFTLRLFRRSEWNRCTSAFHRGGPKRSIGQYRLGEGWMLISRTRLTFSKSISWAGTSALIANTVFQVLYGRLSVSHGYHGARSGSLLDYSLMLTTSPPRLGPLRT